ncbi:MAG TPA: DUF3616 domain-containing protein [Coleofasciculaceae cyanobacterium]|jgi:hypothetical protein
MTSTTSISFLGVVPIVGNVYDGEENQNDENKNISAIEVVDDLLIMGADEGRTIKVLKYDGKAYKVEQSISLSSGEAIDNDDGEVDIEGIAHENGNVYVVGSHSCKRVEVKPEESYDRNRKALKKIKTESRRDYLFRLHLDATSNTEHTSLQPIIDSKKVLKLFSQIPSKENGIDIEGIAVYKERLYVGFRGPVLRGNWVPVLKCKFANPITEADLIFVNLGGRGVRDIIRVDNGFLILAGPVGDGSDSYQVYFWNGEDCIPGERASGQVGQIEFLGEIPAYENMKAEGIALIKERKSDYEVVVVFDGVENGAPVRLKIAKP